MQNKFTSDKIDNLIKAFESLNNGEDIRAFLNDLCTIKEMQDMSSRLEVAMLLKKGMNYQEISEKTGTSSATISRIKSCLDYGSGGYSKVIDLLKDK